MRIPASLPHPASAHRARRLTWLRRIAWLCAALILLIIGLSAHMRLTRATPPCEPWPQCQGQAARAPDADRDAGPQAAAAPAARTAHRTAASAVLLLVLAMLIIALGPRPALWAEGRIALGLLGLALSLAALGFWAGASARPAVMLGNLLGGFAMFALGTRLASTTMRPPARDGRRAPSAPWIRLAILLVLAQAALGGLASADAGGAAVAVAHRAAGLALAALLLTLSWRAWRRGARAVAAGLAGLSIALAVLGLVLVTLDAPLALALMHNLCAALLLALLASVPGGYFSSPGRGA
ncbi:COX15/CtaA family protein [Castellaniella sp. GW247-6E4]|uniref:COX15/CtaA family protein n=1 Tax=Castellaniella sp. GW247-6E4 TaxID=3140380 RepID=UPI0033147B08